MSSLSPPQVYRVRRFRRLTYATAIILISVAALAVCVNLYLCAFYWREFDEGDFASAIGLLLLPMFVGYVAYSCFWCRARWLRLELTPHFLDFCYGQKDTLRLEWTAFARIGRPYKGPLVPECLILTEPIPIPGRLNRKLPHVRAIPLPMFDPRWREGQLGADLRRFAPHLFESDAPPGETQSKSEGSMS
jgi:hypothetical protein